MRRYTILVIGVVVAAVCVRLGMWQLDRLDQRRARNAIIEARLAREPLRMDSLAPPTVPGGWDSLRYRRVVVRGPFDLERQVVVMSRVHRGVPGVYVVTPLLVAEDTAILVERGWAPAPDGRSVRLDAVGEMAAGAVEGMLLPPSAAPDGSPIGAAAWPLYVRELNPTQLAASYDYVILPLALRRAEGAEGLPPTMRAVALPQLTNGPHLSYALQWFSFGAIALIGSAVLFVRSRPGLTRS
ncbi:MAG: SURF1 family protein [Gemmatimonadales bacterium]